MADCSFVSESYPDGANLQVANTAIMFRCHQQLCAGFGKQSFLRCLKEYLTARAVLPFQLQFSSVQSISAFICVFLSRKLS